MPKSATRAKPAASSSSPPREKIPVQNDAPKVKRCPCGVPLLEGNTHQPTCEIAPDQFIGKKKTPSKNGGAAHADAVKLFRDRIVGFERIPADQLVVNEKNWRTHPKEQHKVLRGLLKEIGIADVNLVRKLPDGRYGLIDGHLRKEIYGQQPAPSIITDLNEEEADKLLASLDPLAALAGADEKKLEELLMEIKTDDDDLKAFFSDLAAQHHLSPELSNIQEVDAPLPPDAPKAKKGDLWILGRHRLLCGDSGNRQDLERLLGGKRIHTVNTDPPYNVKVEPRSNNAIAAGLSSFAPSTHHQRFDSERNPGTRKKTTQKMRAKDRPLANDFVSDEAFDVMLLAWFGNMAFALEPGRAFYIWGGYANVANYPAPLKASGLYFSQAIIWVKGHPVLTRKDYMGNHEWAFYGWKEGGAHQFYGPNNTPDVWAIKKVSSQNMVHLTEKPVELAARAISYSTREDENVLDLFGGSGSTLIACEQLNRNAFLMELDPAYVDVIVERFEKTTGGRAELIRPK